MQKMLLTNGNVFKRTDGRWNGVVWYFDEQGERKRKSFCGTSKPEVKAKITEYIADFKHSSPPPASPGNSFGAACPTGSGYSSSPRWSG